jgi:MoaA/NifB/PqqE/SkfB family radical SAM enzyme
VVNDTLNQMQTDEYKIDSCAFELTLRCNAKCLHCGSDAKDERVRELSTDEAIKMIEDVASLGCKRFTFSGGEPFLRRDWPELAKSVNDAGMNLEAITNGLLVEKQAEAIIAAGFFTVGFSVDGPHEIHDELRRDGKITSHFNVVRERSSTWGARRLV